MINNQSLSFEATKANMIAYVEAKPASQKWKDFVGTGVGVTFIELLASVSTYKAFQTMVQRREAYFDTAQFNSSVQELAFNRGYMQAPTLAAEITVTLTPTADFDVVTGSVVGTYDLYQLIAYETKSFVEGVSSTLLCVVGNIQTINNTISGIPAFQTFRYTADDTYIASQLEQFKVDGAAIVPLMSELNYLSSAGNDFMLRRVVNNVVKIYSGNGVVGYCKPTATTTSYRYITYGAVPADGTALITNADVASFVFFNEASYGLSTEELRAMALYYPLDGRISQDRDYESAVIKFFGGSVGLVDAYSFNDNPNQHIYLLVSATLPGSTITAITEMIDIRRGQGIQVFYHQYLLSAGETLSLGFKLSDQYNTTENILLVHDYVEGLYLNKFFKQDVTVSSFQIAIDVTQLYGFPLYPVSDQQLMYIAGDYVKDVNLTFTTL